MQYSNCNIQQAPKASSEGIPSGPMGELAGTV